MIDVKKMCRDKGLRMTEQRRIIARVISESKETYGESDHPDVDELYSRVSIIYTKISIATVYRTVKLFEEYGAIEKHEFKDGRSRYEAIEDHHHDHLIDIETGEILKYPAGHSKAGKALFKRRFIPARLSDNPYLSESGDYEAMLLSLPEHQRKQLLEGDWDIKEGAAFTEFDRKIHVVKPFPIPNNWIKFRACDYGYGSYSGVLWFAVSPDEQLVVYRELYVSKVLATDLADMILEVEAGDGNIRYGVLDSSLWHNRGDTGPSLAEQMITRGCRWRPSDRSKGSRVSGKNEIHRRLQVDEFTEQPRLVFFSTCTETISQLPAIPLDKRNPEDVDTNAEDHLYDALRYGIMSRPRFSIFDYDPNVPKPTYQPSDSTFGY